MDRYSLAPVAAVLDAAYSLLDVLVTIVQPFAGPSSTVVVIVLVTLAVRICLVPVGIAQVRAESTRRRLAPLIAELRRRYRQRPDLLRRKTLELYAIEKASPLDGCLPLVVQAPVLSIVYALFALPTVNGHVNALLAARFGEATLGSSLLAAVQTGAVLQTIPVYLPLLLGIAGIAWLSRRLAVRTADAVAPADRPGVAAISSWLPFVTVLVAAIVPLAAAIYLAVTTAWTVAERWLLRRLLQDERPTRRSS